MELPICTGHAPNRLTGSNPIHRALVPTWRRFSTYSVKGRLAFPANAPCGRNATMLATSFTAESASPPKEREAYPGVQEKFWTWVADGKEYRIRYQTSGTSGPAILMVHGFGGNCDHFRKNTPVLGEWGQAYAIDLLGYGYSDKPDPRQLPKNSIYNFECWARQLQAFIQEVIQQPTFVVCNSIGGLPGLLVAQYLPDQVLGVQLLDVSLRKLHVKNQSPLARPLIAAFQDALRTTPLGRSFFDSVAQAKTVKNILQQAYCDPNTVTDELVSLILQPGMQPGAADVFLDFISYSGGPLPADAIAQCPVPVSMLWGAEDPWEKIEWGRELAQIPQVEEFVTIPGVGHCPQDEAPQLVNPLIRQFVMRHADQ